jgi:hypothetical protein
MGMQNNTRLTDEHQERVGFGDVLKEDFGWRRIGLTAAILVVAPFLQASILPSRGAIIGSIGIMLGVIVISSWLSVWLARNDNAWQSKYFAVVLIGGFCAAGIACLLYGALCVAPLEMFNQCSPENVRAVLIVNFGAALLTTLVLIIRGGKFAQEVDELREKAKRGENLVGN